jgi:hypothetical protein
LTATATVATLIFDQPKPAEPMKNKISLLRNFSAAALMIVAIPATFAETSSSDFTSESDKSMAAAHESFLKGDMKKASASIDKAAASVSKESEKVADGAKEGVKKAGDELKRLGQGVKSGAVKSGDELKKTFAHVDNALAKAWHATAEESMKAGKDASTALKKAGESLSGAAKWSGTELKKGAQSSMKAVGEGMKAGGSEVKKWFNDIGDGIKDVERKL